MSGSSPRAFYLAAGYLVCLAAIGILLMMDAGRSRRIDAIERRLSMERSLHEREWEAQQQSLAASRARERGMQAEIDRLRARR